jgi:MFS family permease
MKTIRRAAAFLICSALVWVSPGLEAFAAESRLIQLNLLSPVTTGRVGGAGPVQLPLNFGLPSGLETPGLNSLNSVHADWIAPELQAQAGLLQNRDILPALVQTEFPFEYSQDAKIPADAALISAIPASELPQGGLPPSVPSSTLDDPWHAELSLVDATGRIANTHRIGHEIQAVRAFFKDKTASIIPAAVYSPFISLFGETRATNPQAKLNANPSLAPPAETGAQAKDTQPAVPATSVQPATTQTPPKDAPVAVPASPVQTGDSGSQPPAPPSKGSDEGGKGKSNSPWRNAYIFIAGLIVAQVGVEAWSAAWAKWVQTSFNTPSFDAYTTITMVAMGTSLVAGFAGGWITDKLGLKKTFIGTLIGVAAVSAATLLLFQLHILTAATPALLIGLVIARAFMNSANGTAQQTVPIAIFKDDKAAFQKYNSSSQFILEIAGIAVPYAIGALLGVFGFVGTLWIMPVALLASAVLLALLLKIADVVKAKKAVAAKPTDPGLLKIAMSGYPALVLLNYLLYAVIAINYGNFIHPGTTIIEQAAASGVAGKIVSLYSMGGLIAAAILSGVPQVAWKWLKSKWPWLNHQAENLAILVSKKTGLKSEAPKEEDPHADARSAAKWLILSAIGMVGFIPLLFSSPMLAALAMIPFGITNVMSTLQLISIAQMNTPQEKKGKVMGMIRTISTALATAGIFGFSKLFKLYPGSHFPFAVFLGLGAVLAAYYVFTSFRLRRHIKSHETTGDTK